MSRDRDYGVLIDIWNKAEPYFRLPTQSFLARPWRVAPDFKRRPVHEQAGTRHSLIAVFPEAIAIGSPIAEIKDGQIRKALLTTPVTVLLAWLGTGMVLDGHFSLIAWVVLFFAVYALAFQMTALKNWLCAPADWPIIFNRKDRTVSYSVVTYPPDWKSCLARTKQLYCIMNWDAARVRNYELEQVVNWRTTFKYFRLFLCWGGENGDPYSLSHSVAVGRDGRYGDAPMWMLWEHIRRYMEENGSAIPDGEALSSPGFGRRVFYPPYVLGRASGQLGDLHANVIPTRDITLFG
ncbi:hypothetical protein ACVBGC_30890 [Burkholderia stagnalis]